MILQRSDRRAPTGATVAPSSAGGSHPRSVGFLIGTVAAVGFAISLGYDAVVSYDHENDPSYSSSSLGWLTVSLPAVGYVAAIVLTVRRSTRRLGQGMLIGLTVMVPVGFGVAVWYFLSKI